MMEEMSLPLVGAEAEAEAGRAASSSADETPPASHTRERDMMLKRDSGSLVPGALKLGQRQHRSSHMLSKSEEAAALLSPLFMSDWMTIASMPNVAATLSHSCPTYKASPDAMEYLRDFVNTVSLKDSILSSSKPSGSKSEAVPQFQLDEEGHLVVDTTKPFAVSPQPASSAVIPRDSKPIAALEKIGSRAAVDKVTSTQKISIVRAYELLVQGVEVVKHGLTGKPRIRYLSCNDDMTQLRWRSTRASSTSGDSAFRVSLGFSKADREREVDIQKIIDISDDLSTQVMQRSLNKNFVTPKANSRGVFAPGFICIILRDRSFDFDVGEDRWDVIYHALKILVNFYQNILPLQLERDAVAADAAG